MTRTKKTHRALKRKARKALEREAFEEESFEEALRDLERKTRAQNSRAALEQDVLEQDVLEQEAFEKKAREKKARKALVKNAHTEIATQMINLAHTMIMTAIMTNDSIMLRILFNGACNKTFLKTYLICATLKSVACMREVLYHMDPIRDGRVIYHVLNAYDIPIDCFKELMITVAHHMSEQQLLNIVALTKESIQLHQFEHIILPYLRGFKNRRTFPSSICRHLFERCELFISDSNRYFGSTQHSSCIDCEYIAATNWDATLKKLLHKQCSVDVIVELIYDFAADLSQVVDKLPISIWHRIEQFSGCSYNLVNELTVYQVGYQVVRNRCQCSRMRTTLYYKPSYRGLRVNPSGEFPETDLTHPVTRYMQYEPLWVSNQRVNTESAHLMDEVFNAPYTKEVDIIKWQWKWSVDDDDEISY